MKEYLIIGIDDDEQFLSSLEASLPAKVSRLCEQFQCRFEFVSRPEELYTVIAGSKETHPALLISDQIMPGITGIELIEKMKKDYQDLVCVLLTGHAGLDSAKYAINCHLLDQYVSKPIVDLQEFAYLIANLLKKHHLDLEERERSAQLAQTVEALRISNEKIRAMHGAAVQVAMLSKNLKALDFNEVMELITHEVPKIFHADWSMVCFPEEDPCLMENSHHQNCPQQMKDLLARQDVKCVLENLESHFGPTSEKCDKIGAQAPELIIPLSASHLPDTDKIPPGYLCMCHITPAAEDSPELLEYKVRLVSEIISANLTSARLYQKARQESQTDSLTGTSSRRVFEEKLQQEQERITRYGGSFCIASIDIDYFKRINDTCGHPAGDRLLVELSNLLRSESRGTDIVARYGGDEFVILMPETTLDDAVGMAQRIRKRLNEMITIPGQKALTLSCGVAESVSGADGNVLDILRRADEALYEAKRAGRDRVETAKKGIMI